jgi:outer membrane murein-binding lipoprotein Lpp
VPNHHPKRLILVAVVSGSLLVAGCATASKDISSSYVSPLSYQSYDCEQISAEAQRIKARVVELGGRLDQAASNDKAIAAAGAILFWPALFALGGTKQQEAEYARLKGEFEALQQVSIQKKCGLTAPSGPGQAEAAVNAVKAAASAPDAR